MDMTVSDTIVNTDAKGNFDKKKGIRGEQNKKIPRRELSTLQRALAPDN